MQEIKRKIIENFVDTEQVIADKLKGGEENIILTKNFGYIALRLTGTGITKRVQNGVEIEGDRDLGVFSSPELMDRYKNINICFSHPKNEEGKHEELGFDYADSIIGNTIDSFVKGSEIWVVGRIFNLTALDFMVKYRLSTSPHFKSYWVEGEDGVLIEQPLTINHLAIVASGYWDAHTENEAIGSDGVEMIKEADIMSDKVDNVVDTILESPSTATTGEEKKELVDVATNTIPTPSEELAELKQEVANLKEGEAKEAETLDKLAQEHKEISDKEDKVADDATKKDEAVVDETPKEEVKEETKAKDVADDATPEVVAPQEENKEESIVEDTLKEMVVNELINEANWTDDDAKRDAIIKEVAELVDEASTKGMKLVRPHYGSERLTPSATLKRFLNANRGEVASKYQGIISHIDSASLELGLDIFKDMQAKVRAREVEGVKKGGLTYYPDGSMVLRID